LMLSGLRSLFSLFYLYTTLSLFHQSFRRAAAAVMPNPAQPAHIR
jgi:hypothetical protein